jgi:putative sigma-54 modulation protein
MQIQITGRQVEVTQALREFINNKFSKLERHFDHITKTHVVLSLEKGSQVAEANISISGGDLFAKSSAENMYAAIDSLLDKLDRQILKHKEKLKSKSVPRQVFESTDD